MYQTPFYISKPVGNNAFSFENRENKNLFVPSLKQIESFDEICLGNEIVFEEYDEKGVLQSCRGLEHLYELNWNNKKLFLVDNHNHVFFFWYWARDYGMIYDNSLLYHIDEHADTRDPGTYLLKPDSKNLDTVFEYTNFTLNVGNYIISAEREGLIGKTIQMRGEGTLNLYQEGEYNDFESGRTIILNLDLDFFSPGLDYIEYNLKKQVILDIASKADLITVCTSPFFIHQERALKVFQEIFGQY